ncbi:MAG: hypothetical protein ACREDR_03030, partial [Blastocatellia bacterium]
MKRLRKRIFLAVTAVAALALVVPFIGRRASASSTATVAARPVRGAAGLVGPAAAVSGQASQNSQMGNGQLGSARSAGMAGTTGSEKKLSRKVLNDLGILPMPAGMTSGQIGQMMASAVQKRASARSGGVRPQAGEPVNMSAAAAFSAGIITSEGGRNTQFDEVLTLGDWDGLEDLAADHSGKVDDFSGKVPTVPTGPLEFTITREAISEHTIANGFPEDIFYYGDSFGNVYVTPTTSLTQQTPAVTPLVINLPTVLNAFGNLNSDDQVVITGLAVEPVADLSSFANVNGTFSSFNNLVGEILYVSFTDTESGFRLLSNGTLVRSGLLAFPVADIASAASAPPGILSTTGFPIQVGGAFGVEFSVFDNEAGCAVDDDGSCYVQQVDLVDFTGANIVKIASTDNPFNDAAGHVGWQDRSLATSGFFTLTSLNPTNGQYGTASGPVGAIIGGIDVTQISTATNYSGTANLFGNIAALATGPCNTVYAAVSRSGEPGDDALSQNTEGFFSTAGTALGATPTM